MHVLSSHLLSAVEFYTKCQLFLHFFFFVGLSVAILLKTKADLHFPILKLHQIYRFAIPHLVADSTSSNRIVSLDTCILCDERSLAKAIN